MPAKKTESKPKAKQKTTENKSIKNQSSEKITFSIDKKLFVYAIIVIGLVIVSIGFVGLLSNDNLEGQDGLIDNDDVTLETQSIDENGGHADDYVVNDTVLDNVDSKSDSVVSDSKLDADTSYIPEAGEVVAQVGVVVETDVIDVTLDSYELSTSYIYQEEEGGQNFTDTARAGKQFLIADFYVINKGTVSVYAGSSKITLISGDVYTFEPIIYEGYDALPKSKRIYTDALMSGRVVFEIPLNSGDLKMRYSLSGLSISDRFVTWFLE